MTSQTDADKQTAQVLQYMEPHLTAMGDLGFDGAAVCRGLAVILGVLIHRCTSSEEEKQFAIDSVTQVITDSAVKPETLQ
jgi:hypothetical protein